MLETKTLRLRCWWIQKDLEEKEKQESAPVGCRL